MRQSESLPIAMAMSSVRVLKVWYGTMVLYAVPIGPGVIRSAR